MNLKIAVLVDQLLPGGVQKAAIEEVRNLKKLNFEPVLLILMRRGFEKKSSYLVKNIPHEFLSDRYPKIFQKSFKLPIFKFLSTLHLVSPIIAPLKVKGREFDILISHGTTTSLTTWSLHTFRQIPYISIIHDPMVYILEKVYSKTILKFIFPIIKPLASELEKRFVKSSSLCLVDSSVHVRFLMKNYHINPKILYLGVNPPKKIPPKLGDKIISFGRWDRGKNLTVLLDVIKLIKKAHLIIAGSWTNRNDLDYFRAEIAKKELEGKVTLITNYREKDLARICAKGRVWVHPHFEAFSLSALEAASHGLPIVIPKKSGITELFKENKHGFFPSKISPQKLKAVILPLMENKNLAQKMGKAAANLVKTNYTLQVRAQKLALFINEVLISKPKNMIALEIGHVGDVGIAGGDRLLEKMAVHLTLPLKISVIIPHANKRHWQESQVNVNVIPLKKNYFDKLTGPFGVFTTYLIRVFQAFKVLVGIKSAYILYSSTGIFPDVMPAFFIKLIKPKTFWIARIHHLSLPPNRRPGIFWVNLGSYILEQLSLFAIKVKADLLVTLNTDLKKVLVKKGLKEDKTIVLGGGVDFKAISKVKRPQVKKYDAVFLGRIHPAKGVFDLAPIWQKVARKIPSARLAVIGTGDLKTIKILKRQIKTFDLEKNISLLNFLPQKKLFRVLKESRVFLFTDHEAGFGLAVAEAMAAGLPVVGWDIGILGSVFKSGNLKIRKGNYDSFGQAVIKIITDSSFSDILSKAAVSEAKNLDWPKTSAKFNEVLSHL